MFSKKEWRLLPYASLFSTFTACAIMIATTAKVINVTIIFLPFVD